METVSCESKENEEIVLTRLYKHKFIKKECHNDIAGTERRIEIE